MSTYAFDLLEPFLPVAENAPLPLSLSVRMPFITPSFGVCALGGGVDSPFAVLRSKRKNVSDDAFQYCKIIPNFLYFY
jgi:hypothetical protein